MTHQLRLEQIHYSQETCSDRFGNGSNVHVDNIEDDWIMEVVAHYSLAHGKYYTLNNRTLKAYDDAYSSDKTIWVRLVSTPDNFNDRLTTGNQGSSITMIEATPPECIQCSQISAGNCHYGKCGTCCTGCDVHAYTPTNCDSSSDASSSDGCHIQAAPPECTQCSQISAGNCNYGKCGTCCTGCDVHAYRQTNTSIYDDSTMSYDSW